jgi:hypothetical protein
MTALDQAACRAVDSTGQIADALGLAEHLTDALWRGGVGWGGEG